MSEPPEKITSGEIRYLSKEDLDFRVQEAEEYGGGYDCGGWTFEPPCGGCSRCFQAMASRYFYKEREYATRMQRLGFEVAPHWVIDTTLMSYGGNAEADIRAWVGLGLSHDLLSCFTADEITQEEFSAKVRAREKTS